MTALLRNASIESDFPGSPDYSSSNFSSSPAFENGFHHLTYEEEEESGEGGSKFGGLLPNTPPHSDNDDTMSVRLPTIPENEGDKPAKKKRKSWGQELPIPKTNLPPRYFQHDA